MKALLVLAVSYQVRKPTPPNVEGRIDVYRKREQEAIVVAESESAVATVISKNLTLEDGELVEVTQQRRLGGNTKDVFVQESDL